MRLRLFTILPLFILSMTSLRARAGWFDSNEENCVQAYVEYTHGHQYQSGELAALQELFLQIPNTVLKNKNGQLKLGQLKISDLARQFKSIRVFGTSAPGLMSAEGRDGSINFPESHEVLINEPFFKRLDSDPLRSALGLHEFLGALGYIDDDYGLSATLLALSRETELQLSGTLTATELLRLTTAMRTQSEGNFCKNGNFHARYSNSFCVGGSERTQVMASNDSGGGQSGSGGGGNPFEIELKASLFQHSAEALRDYVYDRHWTPEHFARALDAVQAAIIGSRLFPQCSEVTLYASGSTPDVSAKIYEKSGTTQLLVEYMAEALQEFKDNNPLFRQLVRRSILLAICEAVEKQGLF